MRFGNLEEAVGAYQQGTQWAQQQQQQRQQQAALLALGKMLSQPNGQPQGQPASQPQTPPATAPQGQAPQPPIALQPSTVAAMGGMSPQASAGLAALNRPAAAGPQSQPAAPQPPQGPPPPMPGLSSTAQPDAAGMDDPVKAAQQSIQTIASGIKAANPNIDPATLALATQQQIETIKGVSPLTKAAMTAQMSLLNYQLKQQTLQQRMASEDQKWQIARQNANTREERNQIDAAHFTRMEDLAQGRIDASLQIAQGHDATSRANTQDRDATTVTATGMRDQTSRDNNRDTNVRGDRATTQRQGASDQQTYRSVYSAYLRQHPKDVVGATREARAAVSGVQQGTPRANVPSGDPLAGRGAPAPRSGGGGPKPSAQDMAYLKQHKGDPAVVSAFKKHFGAAAAQAAMR